MAANPIPNAMISERMAYLLQVDVAKRKAHSKTNGTEKTLSLADGASPFRKACSAPFFICGWPSTTRLGKCRLD